MPEYFKAGDQVMLRSGGPYMTVDRITNEQVSCVWFHDQELKMATFGRDLLRSRSEIEAEQSAAIAARRARQRSLSTDY